MASVIQHVSNLLVSEDIEVRPRSGINASSVSSWGSERFQVIKRSLLEARGDVVAMPGRMIAGSDTKHYGKVADNAFRFNPFVVAQSDLTGFHGTNEKIGVSYLADRVRAYIHILTHGAG